MQLTQTDQAMLRGRHGGALRMAMELVVAAGGAMGAESLLDITGAHIDGCLYHGQAGLDFAQRLVDGGGQVAVPTTLNVSSLDLLHPQLYRGDRPSAEAARELMGAYEAMGCRPTWTCAPYQLDVRPGLGEQIAWGESNAIVFANSVLGARTNRYGDFLDICCALTGRAPEVGLHTDQGRKATFRIDVDIPGDWLDDDLSYVAIGHLLGRIAGTDVAMIYGLDARADEDRLKALGATAASSGAVAMFHADGVTPEAEALGMGPYERTAEIGSDDLRGAIAELGSDADTIGAVSIGTPHASARELNTLATMCRGQQTSVPFYVNTGRDVLEEVDAAVISAIEGFGAHIVTDTCTYITPILAKPDGPVMTNSGKWAYYAPGNLGVSVVMGTVEDCVASSVAGSFISGSQLV